MTGTSRSVWPMTGRLRLKLRLLVSAGLLATSFVHSADPIAAQLEPPVATGPACDIQLSLGNPAAGTTEVPLSVVMNGTAFDMTAADGTGISQVQAFLGSRDQGGAFLGEATFVPDGPFGAWTLLANFPPTAAGPGDLFIYGQSASSGLEATLDVPITIAESTPPPDSAVAICPSMISGPEGIAPAMQQSVTSVEWQWTAANDPSAYTITFLDSGTYNVRADCNLSTGGYFLEGDLLSLTPGP